MPVYVMLSSLTDKGREAINDDPESLRGINKEVELLGAKIIDQFAVLGQYDFVNIVEAPSNEVMARLSTRLSAKGNVHPMTMAAIPLDNLIEALKSRETPW